MILLLGFVSIINGFNCPANYRFPSYKNGFYDRISTAPGRRCGFVTDDCQEGYTKNSDRSPVTQETYSNCDYCRRDRVLSAPKGKYGAECIKKDGSGNNILIIYTLIKKNIIKVKDAL